MAFFTLITQLEQRAISVAKSRCRYSAAGVSAVPMSARVVQRVVSDDTDGAVNPLMAAMGPNVAGVIGSAPPMHGTAESGAVEVNIILPSGRYLAKSPVL